MRSFNEKFNKHCGNIAFWHKLSVSLACVNAQAQSQDSLTRKDKEIVKAISKAIYDIMQKAQQAEGYHSRRLKKLKGEYLNER